METKISSQQLVMIFVNEAFEERQSVGQRERERDTARDGEEREERQQNHFARFRFIERAKIKGILKPPRIRAQRFLRHKSQENLRISRKIILALSGQTKHH